MIMDCEANELEVGDFIVKKMKIHKIDNGAEGTLILELYPEGTTDFDAMPQEVMILAPTDSVLILTK